MKLKTLKDLEKGIDTLGSQVSWTWTKGDEEQGKEYLEEYALIKYGELKQEAIKWIKSFNEGWINLVEENENHITPERINMMNQKVVIIDWIKMFFNIKEEDLR